MKRKIMNGCTAVVFLMAAVLLTSCSELPGETTGKTANEDTVSVGTLFLTKVGPVAPMDVCPNGGITVYGGVDSNGNGSLDTSEITSTQYVCHGTDGRDGSPALISAEDEPAGPNCPSGGKKVNAGNDSNNNGVLDQSEISTTAFICNGLNGAETAGSPSTLVSISSQPSGSNCEHGGIAISSGPDSNANNTLDASEIATFNYVCNGSSGPTNNQPPAAPSYVYALADSGKTSLNWMASYGATSYNIYWSTSPGVSKTNGTKIANVTNTWYNHTSLSNGTTYYYVITAVNNYGESLASSEVSAKPTAPTTPPAAPMGLYAKAGEGQVDLSWIPSSGASSYNIYWSTSPGVSKTNGTKIADVTNASYGHISLTNGTTYYYVVAAVNSFGESAASNQASATPKEPPAAPTGVTALAGDGQVTLTWNAVPGISDYKVYRATSTGVTTTSPNNGNVSSVYYGEVYKATGLINGTKYYFVVTAFDYSAGESAASIEVSATPVAGATSPRSKAASSVTDTMATLNGDFTYPTGYVTTAWFEYGTTTDYGTTTSVITYVQTGDIYVSANLANLEKATTYHFRFVTQNSTGTYYGSDQTFITAQTPSVIATLSSTANVLAVDSTAVYWSESDWVSGASIKKVGLNGGTVMAIASGLTASYSSGKVNSMAVDSKSIYCTIYSEYNNSAGSLIKVAKTAPYTVTVLATGLNSPTSILIDSSDIFWVEKSATPQIRKMSKSGGSATTLVAVGGSIGNIALDSENVFWSQYANGSGSINKISKTGGTTTSLLTGAQWAFYIKVASTSIYYADDDELMSIDVSGGPSTTIAELAHGGASLIGVDATYVYALTDYPMNNISKINLVNGETTLLAARIFQFAIAMDDASIYWVEGWSTTAINKIFK